ncbi:hypothetical protein [Marinilabilia sp.]
MVHNSLFNFIEKSKVDKSLTKWLLGVYAVFVLDCNFNGTFFSLKVAKDFEFMYNLKLRAMKRKFLFVLSSVLFLAALPMVTISADNHFIGEVVVQEELTFNEIELSEVPSAVTEAAREDFPDAEIAKAKVAEVSGKKIYKIIFKTEDGNEESSLYHSDGTAYSPEA